MMAELTRFNITFSYEFSRYLTEVTVIDINLTGPSLSMIAALTQSTMDAVTEFNAIPTLIQSIWVSIERSWIGDEHQNHHGSSQSTMNVLTRFTAIPTLIQSIWVSIERSWIGDEHENRFI
ncbi:MAG: hypothetical protein EOP45_16840 [Sphingobacteriaceae bacterium]|nr:MAG: hypothetical protein EOP45_16840 [Sphingobacteriaceae bacterium]